MNENETRDLIRKVFSGFHSLNLLFLLEDLRRDLVCRGSWIGRDLSLCPVAHGWKRMALSEERLCDESPCAIAGVPCKEGRQFVSWWDQGFWETPISTERDALLLSELTAMYRERLDDADAVQSVICQEETCLT